jgi:signal transduction histidine kinase
MGIALQNARLFGRLSKRGAELQGTNTKLEEELAERKKIQAELEKAMELAKAAAVAKDQFLASVSHEIRTPLNAIIGMTGLMLDTQLTETQQEWLNLIELSGNALFSLVSTYRACPPPCLALRGLRLLAHEKQRR